MALRFNPPPNWPAPPEGFNPPAGWQPDPAWGPAPEGWQLWVEDSTPGTSAGSAPQTGSAADAAWAPTQAVPTGSSVADPTGQSASAPSGDYTGSTPFGGSVPGSDSSSGAAPYAPGMNYAQSPTPYHNQSGAPGSGGGLPPQGGPGWQPGMSAPMGPKPVTRQWWFWLIIVLVVVALLAGVLMVVNSRSHNSHNNATGPTAVSSQGSYPTSQSGSGSGPGGGANPGASSTPSPGSPGTTEKNPLPADQTITMSAGKYSTDEGASVDVSLGVVEWNANDSLKSQMNRYSWHEPDSGKVYVRVPVEITYHGTSKFNSSNLKIEYDQDGNTTSAENTLTYSAKDEFSAQDMPRDGGTAKGYFTFQLTTQQANDKAGVWVITAFMDNNGTYVKPKLA